MLRTCFLLMTATRLAGTKWRDWLLVAARSHVRVCYRVQHLIIRLIIFAIIIIVTIIIVIIIIVITIIIVIIIIAIIIIEQCIDYIRSQLGPHKHNQLPPCSPVKNQNDPVFVVFISCQTWTLLLALHVHRGQPCCHLQQPVAIALPLPACWCESPLLCCCLHAGVKCHRLPLHACWCGSPDVHVSSNNKQSLQSTTLRIIVCPVLLNMGHHYS